MSEWTLVVAIGLSIVAYVAAAIGYGFGFAHGREKEHDVAWGDGYRAGERAGMGAPSPKYERWIASSDEEDELTRFRHGERWNGPEDEACPECGGAWPECEGIRDDGEVGCQFYPEWTPPGNMRVGARIARRKWGRR
jgi:hypothetical protein